MRRILPLFIGLFCLITLSSSAQNWGNGWIDYSKAHYKIQVAEKGLYRVGSAELAAAGISASGINPKTFRMFRNGVEVPLLVEGEADNQFNPTDYLLFVGEPNDGLADSLLFQQQNYHANKYFSLFTDTSCYYLVWGGINGKRFTPRNGSSLSGTAENFYTEEALLLIAEEYFRGRPFAGRSYRSKYNLGEGWQSTRMSLGTQRTYNIAVPNYYSSGTTADLEVLSFGQGDDQSVSPNHHQRFSVGPSASNLSTLFFDTTFTGYQVIKRKIQISSSNISSNGLFIKAQIINDLGANADNNAIGYFKLEYPRDFNMNNGSERFFNFGGAINTVRLKFTSYGKSTPLFFDLDGEEVVSGTRTGSDFEVMLNSGAFNRSYLLADSTDFKAAKLSRVNFFNLNPSANNFDYLIITHKKLLPSANSYANYRSSMAGGNYNTLVVTVDQLYDQFYYGLHHPLAIRNFAGYLLKEQSISPKYMLLLGKGYQSNYLRDPQPLVNRFEEDLVPTYGIPGSDNSFTFDLDTFANVPIIATGRISARSNQEALNYLSKVQAFESAPREEWQKNVLQVSGGQNETERIQFSQIIDGFEQILDGPKIGAQLFRYDKDVSAPVTSDPKKIVIKNLNDGLLMYNYFGHGSASKIGVDVGDAIEYSNAGKYPLMFFNGCSVGNCFGDASIGEDFILSPNRGAVLWLANSNLGYVPQLRNWANAFLTGMANDLYGESIGDMLQNASSQFNVIGYIDQTQVEQITLQGDPAIKLYSSPEPDYEIGNDDIYLNPANVTALSDSFIVVAIVKNLGRATQDSVFVRLRRTLPDNSVVTYGKWIKEVYNRDTVSFTIISPNISTRGNNRFEVSADANMNILEVDETNNTGILDFYMPSNSVNLLYPERYAIISNNTVELIFQNNNLLSGINTYVYEVDTTHKFNSPWKQTGSISSNGFNSVNVNLLTSDTLEYFWRAKIDIPASEGGVWEESSFTYIGGSPSGWNQSVYGQFRGISHNNTLLDSNSKRFEFVPNQEAFTVINSRRLQNGSQRQIGIRKGPLLLSGSFCGGTGVRVVLIDPVSLSARPGLCPNGVSTQFDVTNAPGRADFKNFLRGVATGDYIMMQTITSGASFLQLDSIPDYLSPLGSDTALINAMDDDNYAWAFIARKGDPAFASEDSVYGANIVADSTCRAEKTLFGRWYEGIISSELIGPSSSYKEFSYGLTTAENMQTDTIGFNIYGVDRNNTETLLYPFVQASSIDISSVDAEVYPFLRIKGLLKDTLRRTAPQLGRWTVLYDGIPEGTLLIDQAYLFEADSLNEGDTLKLNIIFKNISPFSFSDSIDVRYSLIDNNRIESVIESRKYINLSPSQQHLLAFNMVTNGLTGLNRLKLEVNPAFAQPELYLTNNVINKDFLINADPYNPILDVTFDGRHIFDRDIIAPSPNILISIKDNNPLIDNADTSNFIVKFKKANELNFTRIFFGDPNSGLILEPSNGDKKAEAYFRPGVLGDGVYDLSVEVRDMSGNFSGFRPYQISFEVINESTITNIYPYPNPFSSSMQFVYTLTGDKIPDEMKIQIYTVSGKLIREVSKQELEPIYIGNNISDFRWDGTDQYGDQLANGVYFYRIIVKDDGSALKRADSRIDKNEDKFFKKNTGKIYLMR